VSYPIKGRIDIALFGLGGLVLRRTEGKSIFRANIGL